VRCARSASDGRARVRLGALTLVAILQVSTAAVAHAESASRARHLSETYVGTGSGTINGTAIAGHAILHGKGTLLGPGTLRGQATGSLTSASTAMFSGSGTMTGPGGKTLVLKTDDAQVSGSLTANLVTFSGAAVVETSSTAAVARSLTSLAYKGSYDRASGKVSITLSGVANR
jgi:hypothetical protein